MRLFAAILLTLVVATATAQQRPALTPRQIASIDTYVQSELARQKIPGIEIGIYSRGELLLTRGYGLANVELAVPVKAETIFQTGSVGKQFVSAAIMMLVEEGKLSLDDSITKYFPAAPATWKPILLKNLLSHTSGLADYEDEAAFTDPKNPFYLRLDFTEDQLMSKFFALAIENPPGEEWNYRNANYAILGILIHKITGTFYGDFLQKQIFRPLGMTHTQIISDRDIIPNRAAGYEIDDHNVLKNQTWVSPTFNSTADGTLYFNVFDIGKWDAALYTTQLLKQSSLDRMWTVFPLNDGKPNPAGYGFAWVMDKQRDHKRISHSGAWQGFTCNFTRYPDDSLSVAVLTNLDSDHANPGIIAHVVAGLAEPTLLPAKFVPIKESDPNREKRLSIALNHIAANEAFPQEAAPALAALMKDGLSPAIRQRVAAVWPGGTIEFLGDKPQPGAAGTRGLYRIIHDAQSILVTFALTPEGKISVLGFYPNRDYDD